MAPIKTITRHGKNEENITYNEEKRHKSSKTDRKEIHVVEIIEKNIKTVIETMLDIFKDLEEIFSMSLRENEDLCACKDL